MMNALIKWWRSMGSWRWVNAALVLVSFVMSLIYGFTLVGWTDHGRRELNEMDIHFDTRGALRAGQISQARIWIEEPIDIELKINNEKIIAISKERFDTNNEYKFKIELPMNISDSLVIAASINEATEIANWNIGRLFR